MKKIRKSSAIKSLLTTASLASFILTTGNANAGPQTDWTPSGGADADVSINKQADWITGPQFVPIDDDILKFNNTGQSINFTGAGTQVNGVIVGSKFIVKPNGQIGTISIADTNSYTITTSGATGSLKINFAADGELSITNPSTMIGNINFNGNDGNLIFAGSGTIGGTIDGNTNGGNIAGSIKITGGADALNKTTITIDKAIGNIVAIDNIQIGDAINPFATLKATNGTNVVKTDKMIFGGDNSIFEIDYATLNVLSGTNGKGKIVADAMSVLIGNIGATGSNGANILTSVTTKNGGDFTPILLGQGTNEAHLVTQTFDGNQLVIIAGDSSITTNNINNNIRIANGKNLTLRALDEDLTIDNANNITIAPYMGGQPAYSAGTLTTEGLVIFGDSTLGTADGAGKLAVVVNSGELRTSTNAASTFEGGTTLKANSLLTMRSDLTTDVTFDGNGVLDIGSHILTGDVDLANNGTVSIDGGSVNGIVTTSVDNQGTYKFKQGNLGAVGANGFSFASLEVAETADVNSLVDIYAANLEVKANKFTHKAGNLNLSSGIMGAGTFVTETGGDLYQLGYIGHILAAATLGDGVNAKTFKASGEAYTTAITLAPKSSLDASNGYKNNGDLIFADNTSVNLGANTLELTGDVIAEGNLQITLNLNSPTVMGKIVAANTKIAGRNIDLKIINNALLADNTDLVLFTNVDGAPATFIIDEDGPNIFTYSNGILNIKLDENKLEDVADGIGGEEGDIIKNAANETGDALIFDSEIYNLSKKPETKALAKEAKDRIKQTTAEAITGFNEAIHHSVIDGISTSLSTHLMPMSMIQANKTGFSSGDEDSGYNNSVWIRGFGGKARQKTKRSNVGYDSTTYGGIIGADTLVSDELRLGIAGSFSDGRIKMKDQKKGDTVRTSAFMFSIYSTYEFNDYWYLKAITTFGTTNVSTREKNYKSAQVVYSTGKYKSLSYAVDATVGYKHNLSSNSMIVPEFGIRALGFNSDSYTEIGASHNRVVSMDKAGANYEGILGASLVSFYDFSGAEVSPSIVASVIQELGGRNPSFTAKMNGQNGAYTTKNKSANKTMYNLGADIDIKTGMVDYSLSYDLNCAKKFISHTGSLKMKVNF